MKNGAEVAAFERAFAEWCGARYCIAAANGTVTLQAALKAIGVRYGDYVAVPPLTMAATTLAVLNVGAHPVFWDVDPKNWLMVPRPEEVTAYVPVSLYGLHSPWEGPYTVDDAAQTLRPHGTAAFTSISFQASKILSLGEGGMLATDDEGLAERARSYLSLGYRMGAGEARIDPATLKSPTYERHHRIGVNGRMNDITAAEGLRQLAHADELLAIRRECAEMYRDAIAGCEWLTPQYVPPGWHHDWWTWAVAVNADDDLWETGLDLTPAEQAQTLADAIVAHGGERPFAAWRITYQEPALRQLAPDGTCPIAESLQPRLLQAQTNHIASAERNARALRLAIQEVG